LFIKTLTLHGFKAFADKTEFRFDDGIGGLIGPNGCGKSNVIDAIKWVIGEQKTSELRGVKMEDVIFHGSAERPRSNYAEVEMIISNDTGIIPLDCTEISILRRLHRTEQSEYFINKKEARLKDVQDLFLDTGIGKAAYSVIQQGRIDKILSKNPEERRYLFEEAAGISRYNERKKDYERKIVSTKDNLTRVDDIVRELDKQHSVLKQQAENTKIHFDILAKLKEEEINMLLYRLVTLRSSQKQQAAKSEEIQKNITHQKETFKETEESIKELTNVIQVNRDDITGFEKKKITYAEKINSLQEQKKVLIERRNDLSAHMSRTERNIADSSGEKKNLLDKINDASADIETKLSTHKKNTALITEHNKTAELLSARIITYRADLTRFRTRLEQIKKEQSGLAKEHALIVEKLVGEIDVIKKSLSDNQENSSEIRKRLTDYHKEMTALFVSLLPAGDEESFHRYLDEVLQQDSPKIRETVKEIYSRLFLLIKNNAEQGKLLKEIIREKDPLHDLIFSSQGTYAQKEKIDTAISELAKEHELCAKKIQDIADEITHCENEKSMAQRKMAELEIENAAILQSVEMLTRINEEKKTNIAVIEKKLISEQTSLSELRSIADSAVKKLSENEAEFNGIIKDQAILAENMKKFYESIEGHTKKLSRLQEKFTRTEQAIQTSQSKLTEIDTASKITENDIKNLYENCANQFSEDLRQYEKHIPNREFNPDIIRKNISGLKESLDQVGSINPIAQEEFNTLDERLKEMKKQKKDITDSMEDLIKVVKEIEDSSQELFLTTFTKIQKNFHQVIRRLFSGGKANLVLIDEHNPLTSGIDITIQPPGKNLQPLSLFSGGESTLIAIALMFSIFLVKAAPLCLLDEVDAALDKTNINNLARMLHEFQSRTQFIIISHNQDTVAIIDYLYGITMHNGVTKAVSLKFEKKN